MANIEGDLTNKTDTDSSLLVDSKWPKITEIPLTATSLEAGTKYFRVDLTNEFLVLKVSASNDISVSVVKWQLNTESNDMTQKSSSALSSFRSADEAGFGDYDVQNCESGSPKEMHAENHECCSLEDGDLLEKIEAVSDISSPCTDEANDDISLPDDIKSENGDCSSLDINVQNAEANLSEKIEAGIGNNSSPDTHDDNRENNSSDAMCAQNDDSGLPGNLDVENREVTLGEDIDASNCLESKPLEETDREGDFPEEIDTADEDSLLGRRESDNAENNSPQKMDTENVERDSPNKEDSETTEDNMEGNFTEEIITEHLEDPLAGNKENENTENSFPETIHMADIEGNLTNKKDSDSSLLVESKWPKITEIPVTDTSSETVTKYFRIDLTNESLVLKVSADNDISVSVVKWQLNTASNDLTKQTSDVLSSLRNAEEPGFVEDVQNGESGSPKEMRVENHDCFSVEDCNLPEKIEAGSDINFPCTNEENGDVSLPEDTKSRNEEKWSLDITAEIAEADLTENIEAGIGNNSSLDTHDGNRENPSSEAMCVQNDDSGLPENLDVENRVGCLPGDIDATKYLERKSLGETDRERNFPEEIETADEDSLLGRRDAENSSPQKMDTENVEGDSPIKEDSETDEHNLEGNFTEKITTEHFENHFTGKKEAENTENRLPEEIDMANVEGKVPERMEIKNVKDSLSGRKETKNTEKGSPGEIDMENIEGNLPSKIDSETVENSVEGNLLEEIYTKDLANRWSCKREARNVENSSPEDEDSEGDSPMKKNSETVKNSSLQEVDTENVQDSLPEEIAAESCLLEENTTQNGKVHSPQMMDSESESSIGDLSEKIYDSNIERGLSKINTEEDFTLGDSHHHENNVSKSVASKKRNTRIKQISADEVDSAPTRSRRKYGGSNLSKEIIPDHCAVTSFANIPKLRGANMSNGSESPSQATTTARTFRSKSLDPSEQAASLSKSTASKNNERTSTKKRAPTPEIRLRSGKVPVRSSPSKIAKPIAEGNAPEEKYTKNLKDRLSGKKEAKNTENGSPGEIDMANIEGDTPNKKESETVENSVESNLPEEIDTEDLENRWSCKREARNVENSSPEDEDSVGDSPIKKESETGKTTSLQGVDTENIEESLPEEIAAESCLLEENTTQNGKVHSPQMMDSESESSIGDLSEKKYDGKIEREFSKINTEDDFTSDDSQHHENNVSKSVANKKRKTRKNQISSDEVDSAPTRSRRKYGGSNLSKEIIPDDCAVSSFANITKLRSANMNNGSEPASKATPTTTRLFRSKSLDPSEQGSILSKTNASKTNETTRKKRAQTPEIRLRSEKVLAKSSPRKIEKANAAESGKAQRSTASKSLDKFAQASSLSESRSKNNATESTSEASEVTTRMKRAKTREVQLKTENIAPRCSPRKVVKK